MLHQEIETVLAEMREQTAALQTHTAQQREARIESKLASATETESIAASRRRGEHGRDWQILQQRMDFGQTTLSDIMSGVDHTSEAAGIRSAIEFQLPEMQKAFADIIATSTQQGELSELHDSHKRLAETVERLRALNLGF